jgi:predicted transcriptional regulator
MMPSIDHNFGNEPASAPDFAGGGPDATHELQERQNHLRFQRADLAESQISQWRRQMPEPDEKALVAQILSSYLSKNTVAPADLPSVIESVKKAFAGTPETTPISDGDSKSWEPAVTVRRPAVTVRRSVTPEAVTCLVCGKKFKSLKRHLQTAHQLAPREYRDAFKLKSNYPLVAPAYAARRSDIAKSLGLGRKVGMKTAIKKAGAKRRAKKAAAAA